MTKREFEHLYGQYREGNTTPDVLRALEPYRVQNAVILAAGRSTRFEPLSLSHPKGLLVVKGEVMVERQIRQLQEAGIPDITLVCGHMREQFFYLREKYGVDILINEDYDRYNNSSTLLTAKDRIGSTYICSSDNYFTENVFTPYAYRPYYSGVCVSEDSYEYCMETTRSGRINRVTWDIINGKWSMRGHVYFSKKFSKAFIPFLEKSFDTDPEVRTHFWEYCLVQDINRFPIWLKKHEPGVIQEFDALEELIAFEPDTPYRNC